jgi:predicted DNA-binding transcriptional regulator AlpA
MRKTLSPVPTLGPAKFLDADGCAARYGFSPEHWRRLVDAGKAPQPRRFGRLVRWADSDLDGWDAEGNPAVRTVRGGSR